MKHITILALLLLTTVNVAAADKIKLTANDIISRADESSWRVVGNENILKISLPTGAAYIELNTQLAPKHSNNIKKLARSGFYQGLNIYRFVEEFVAQGGDLTGEKPVHHAQKQLPAEFYHTTLNPLAITELAGPDGYAEKTGFLNGFAVAQNTAQTRTWQVHCSGIFAMARDNDINTGGTEFYVTLGGAQRYLDRNVTVFGRVLEGMEHFYRLRRHAVAGEQFNPITDIQVLADISATDNSQFRVLKTNSNTFKQLIRARKNRTEPWFVARPNYIDVCAMPIPTERLK
ncbi:peptidylprolyl isomerase [Pseudoalteromonas mariniglutinosa]|uniref:peptidylprolyl isomerase n=1 Tax=Pseudoalteromonas mariniglutinosa TaxID=206042 RepID=UPI00384C56C1